MLRYLLVALVLLALSYFLTGLSIALAVIFFERVRKKSVKSIIDWMTSLIKDKYTTVTETLLLNAFVTVITIAWGFLLAYIIKELSKKIAYELPGISKYAFIILIPVSLGFILLDDTKDFIRQAIQK